MTANEVETTADLDAYLDRVDPSGEKLDRLVDVIVGRRVESWYDYCQRLDTEDRMVRACEGDNK